MKIHHRLITSLLYPATLGATLSWWAQALESRLHLQGGTFIPSVWVLSFAFWFLCAYGAWYVRLTKLEASNYTKSMFASDLLDTAVLFVAFSALGLMTGGFRPENRLSVYFCSILVVASASLAGKKLHIIAVVGLLVSVAAIVLRLPGISPHVPLPLIDLIVLVLLWILLVLYQIFAVKWTEAA